MGPAGERMNLLQEALRYLKDGEVVGIFPEATISRSFEVKELKSGAARIAAQAGVPLIPVVLWGTQRMMTKDHPRDFSRHKTISVTMGEPIDPQGGTPAEQTAELHRHMTAMLDTAIRSYPAEEQPPGSWWLQRRAKPSRPSGSGGTTTGPCRVTAISSTTGSRRRRTRISSRTTSGSSHSPSAS